MDRRHYLATLGTGLAAGLAGCSGLGALGGGNGNTTLPPPEDMRADPADLAYPAYGQRLPEVTLPAALADTEVTTTAIDTPLAMTFMYTTCQTACPVLTLALTRAQDRAIDAGFADAVTFAEITFDPARDTAEAFRTYAEERSVDLDAGEWYFLRPASEARAKTVVQNQFGVAFRKTTPEDMDQYMFVHSTLILLVNGEGYVERAYRDGQQATQQLPDDMARIVDA